MDTEPVETRSGYFLLKLSGFAVLLAWAVIFMSLHFDDALAHVFVSAGVDTALATELSLFALWILPVMLLGLWLFMIKKRFAPK